MTDTTKEQAKLTLAEIEGMLETANRGQNAFDLAEIREVLRALLASQTALRRFEWEKHGEGDMEINFCPTCRGVKPWHSPSCEMRTALLD